MGFGVALSLVALSGVVLLALLWLVAEIFGYKPNLPPQRGELKGKELDEAVEKWWEDVKREEDAKKGKY